MTVPYSSPIGHLCFFQTVFQETVVKDYEARLTVLQKENVETRKLLFSHVFQLATILKEDPDEAAVTMLPLEVSQDSIETLSDNLLEAVEQMMAIKTKAVKMSRAVQEYEERLLKSPELEEDKNDNSSVLRELKAMFDDGKELLRVNHKVLEDEKREVAKMRQDLQHERRELNRLRKQVLGDEFLGAAGQTWNVDAGPSWCQGHTNFTISSNNNGDAGEEEMATAPYQINGCLAASGRPGRHGSSRPPSRPGSKPGSRSHSIAREAKCKSPGGAFISGPVRIMKHKLN